MKELKTSEIKDVLLDLIKEILDVMQIKGMGRKMVENQIMSFFDDKNNDMDIELAFYKLINGLRDKGIIRL